MRPQRSIDTISSLGPNIGRYTSDLVAGDIFLPPLPSKDISIDLKRLLNVVSNKLFLLFIQGLLCVYVVP